VRSRAPWLDWGFRAPELSQFRAGFDREVKVMGAPRRGIPRRAREALKKRGFFDMTMEEREQETQRFLRDFKAEGDPERLYQILLENRRSGCHDKRP